MSIEIGTLLRSPDKMLLDDVQVQVIYLKSIVNGKSATLQPEHL